MNYLNRIVRGHALDVLRKMPSGFVDCVVTSPPFWGLRDYGKEVEADWGDWHGQLGLESHPQMYIDHILAVMHEVKRILKPTGTLWLNLGDTYCGGGSHSLNSDERTWGKQLCMKEDFPSTSPQAKIIRKESWLQPKQKLMIPARVAIAMQEDGWILRNEICWHKTNHMPSSVKDRFTTAWESVFFFIKSHHCWFDLDAVRVPAKWPIVWSRKGSKKYTGNNPRARWGFTREELTKHDEAVGRTGNVSYPDPLHTKPIHPLGKNPGDHWIIPTKPFKGAHFAVFPELLVEPCVLAGCPQWICRRCGKPRTRIVEIERFYASGSGRSGKKPEGKWANNEQAQGDLRDDVRAGPMLSTRTIGWTDCGCDAGWDPGVVLDPFVGSGTTCVVAKKLGRNYIGIDLNPSYCEMARRRLASIL